VRGPIEISIFQGIQSGLFLPRFRWYSFLFIPYFSGPDVRVTGPDVTPVPTRGAIDNSLAFDRESRRFKVGRSLEAEGALILPFLR